MIIRSLVRPLLATGDATSDAACRKPGRAPLIRARLKAEAATEVVEVAAGVASPLTASLLGVLGAASARGGGTTVNNVTVAPSTSNSVSNVQKSENTYGTVDPYTSAAGAYG